MYRLIMRNRAAQNLCYPQTIFQSSSLGYIRACLVADLEHLLMCFWKNIQVFVEHEAKEGQFMKMIRFREHSKHTFFISQKIQFCFFFFLLFSKAN